MGEAKAAAAVVQALEARREDMVRIAEGSQAILTTAVGAESAATEAQEGRASRERGGTAGGGAAEAQTAVQQQAKSLEQGRVAARMLAELTEKLGGGVAGGEVAEQISATAEELSATV